MKAMNITLLFDGKTEAAFNFYKTVFDTDYSNIQRMKDMPNPPLMPPEEAEKILHATLPIGSAVLMGMDMPTGRGEVNSGNNFMISLDTSSEEETVKLFDRLAVGGSVMMPVDHQFWGSYFGMLTDQFGIQWMLSYAKA